MKEQTRKYASPDTLFSRFLQRRAKNPTERQISTWEDDGGNVDTADHQFVIINGVICCTSIQRLRAYVTKYWRLIRMQFHAKFATHTQS
ncbi:MAG: hypothetical protein H7328_03135 [Bdellovibrio sp.]|nr:hypothetical protein [Bdellovibrio sp.]